MDDTEWTIGQVARAAGVSVRTLHHYDSIGLLAPARRSRNGYRHYRRSDLERLQRILAYRALGLPLDAIADALAGGDDRRHLGEQLADLDRRIAHLAAIRDAIFTTLEARTMGIDLTPDELLDVFGDHDPTRYAAEAESRWGDSDTWKESQRRTRRYRREDWARMKAEVDAIEAALARALADGEAADSPTATSWAEAHRRHIDRWFYPCTPATHKQLGTLYRTDPRFRAHYDDRAAGLADYLADAIDAAAARDGDA